MIGRVVLLALSVLLPLAVLSVSVETLPYCDSCCRICPQYPIAEFDDAFGGNIPEPREASSKDDGSKSKLKTLAPRQDGTNAKCCNICPGFGIGHPDPLYVSFLQTSDEPAAPDAAASYEPFGFQMPPCCNTCALKSVGDDFKTLLTSVRAHKMAPAPKAKDYTFIETSSSAAVEADTDFDVKHTADSLGALEQELTAELDAEHTNFLETSATTSAQFQLFLGRAAATKKNPRGMCRAPRTDIPQKHCCNSCSADATLSFPISAKKQLKERIARAKAQTSSRQKIDTLVKELLDAAGGNYGEAYAAARTKISQLRAQRKKDRMVQGFDEEQVQKMEGYRQMITRGLDQLAGGSNFANNTLIIKLLNALDRRIYSRIAPLTAQNVPDYNEGIAAGLDHTYFTGTEYDQIKNLPANLQVLANVMLQDGDVKIKINYEDAVLPLSVAPHPSYVAPDAPVKADFPRYKLPNVAPLFPAVKIDPAIKLRIRSFHKRGGGKALKSISAKRKSIASLIDRKSVKKTVQTQKKKFHYH